MFQEHHYRFKLMGLVIVFFVLVIALVVKPVQAGTEENAPLQQEVVTYQGTGRLYSEGADPHVICGSAGCEQAGNEMVPWSCEGTFPVSLSLYPDGTMTITISKLLEEKSFPATCAQHYIFWEFQVIFGTYTFNPNQLSISGWERTMSQELADYMGVEEQARTENLGAKGTLEGEGTFTDEEADGYASVKANNVEVFDGFPTSWYLLRLEFKLPYSASSKQSCVPKVRGIDPQKPGDMISPGADYYDAAGNSVGIIQERWYINGVETTSEVWDGNQTAVVHQYTCLDNIGFENTYEIPAYAPPAATEPPVMQPPDQPPEQPSPGEPGGQPPSLPGGLTPEDLATGVGAILIGLGGLLGIGGVIGGGAAVVSTILPGATGGGAGTPAPPPASPPGASPAAPAPTSFVDNPIWDVMKVNTSAATTITGALDEFTKKMPLDPNIRQGVLDSLHGWQNNPTPENLKKYKDALEDSFKGKFDSVAGGLDKFAKGVDVIDAIGSGLKKASEKGFSGSDQTMITIGTVGTELIKKGVTWTITKNPVIGIADGVVGGVSQAVWGKDGRIDIGAGIDKVGDGIISVTEKTASGLGKIMESDWTNKAKSNTNIALENMRKHINDQIARGKISEASGHARISILEKIITGEK
jgi:hypothetical protein